MLKKIFIVFALFCLSTGYTYSNWYGNHGIPYTDTSLTTNCAGDGDSTGGSHPTYGERAPASTNSSSLLTPQGTTIFGVSSSGNVRCLYWDSQNPDQLSINYTAGWHDESGTTISLSARDRGGSGINRIELLESRNGGTFTSVRLWDSISAANGATVNRSWNKVPTAGEENDTFRYRVTVTDIAGNSSTLTSSNIIQFDLTPPTVSDIGDPSPLSGTRLLAKLSQSITVNINSNTGSPITEIVGYFENHATQNAYRTTPYTNSADNILTLSPSIQNVDGDGSPNDGQRVYSFKITRICDAVGHCIEQGNNSSNTPGLTNYTYPVYADTSTITQKSIPLAQRSNLEDTDNVADGTTYDLTITLADQFGNRIIPVSDIGRNIDFHFDTYNSMYRDQYMRSGLSAVLISPSTTASFIEFPINSAVSPVSYTNQVSTDGNYDFDFKVYVPTYQYDISGYADPTARFSINSIDFDVYHNPSYVSWDNSDIIDNSNAIDFHFAPMFQSEFAGDLENSGFIEGIVQDSDLQIIKNSSRATTVATSRRMYLKYNGDSAVLNNLELRYGEVTPPTLLVGTGTTLISRIPVSNQFSVNSYDLYTRLSQNLGTTIDTIEETFLSTHLTYTIDGLNIVLNSDVIGRDNYWDTIPQSSTNQAGVKILGATASDKIQELTQNQFTDDVRILGKLTKSRFRKDISKRVFNLIRSVPDFSASPRLLDFTSNIWVSSTGNEGQRVLNNSVIVYKNLGGRFVSLGDGTGDTITQGNKTVVVIGGDIYIRENITNSSVGDVLGIIALKDDTGQGGHIFIDNDVTDVHAVLYAEKTLMTAIADINSNGIIDITSNEVISDMTPVSDVNNQLYLYGSIFSENTIGGSRANPIECPFYMTCSDSIEAQKYDLNYMRRYIRIDTDNDGTPDTVANGGSMSQRAIGSPEYQDYPLIIEYNSSIQSTPPPLFE